MKDNIKELIELRKTLMLQNQMLNKWITNNQERLIKINKELFEEND